MESSFGRPAVAGPEKASSLFEIEFEKRGLALTHTLVGPLTINFVATS